MPDILAAPPVELHRCTPRHLDALMAAIERSQPQLAAWLPWADPLPTRDMEREFLADRERAFDADLDYGYLLVDTVDGVVAGGAGLHPKSPRAAEIGYWVRSDRTGRGYATAAARALTSAAFDRLDHVDKVVIRMDSRNLASAAIPPKLGFRLEGTYEELDPADPDNPATGLLWSRATRL